LVILGPKVSIPRIQKQMCCESGKYDHDDERDNESNNQFLHNLVLVEV